MPGEGDRELEIAHVLFVDIVGYSKRLVNTEVLRRPAVSAEGMEEGQRYFEHAVVIDPQFALARARLAQLHTRIALFLTLQPFIKSAADPKPRKLSVSNRI